MSAADTFLAAIEPGQRGLSWTTPAQPWTPAQKDGLVRAIAQDLVATWGTPWSVVQQALFLLAAHFHDQHPVQTGRAKVTLTWQAGDESFEVTLARLLPQRVPPIPTLNGAGAQGLQERPMSRLVASSARAPATFRIEEEAAIVAQLRARVPEAWPTLHARAEAQVGGALLALWQSLQTGGVLTGGALFRRLRHPDEPESSEGNIRILFERRPPSFNQALARSEDGGAFLLNF